MKAVVFLTHTSAIDLQMCQDALDAIFDCMEESHERVPLALLTVQSSRSASHPVRWDLIVKYCVRRLQASMHFGAISNILTDVDFCRCIMDMHLEGSKSS